MSCVTHNCAAEATHRVFWPGAEPKLMCELCAVRAQRIGDALGCYIHVERYVEDPKLV